MKIHFKTQALTYFSDHYPGFPELAGVFTKVWVQISAQPLTDNFVRIFSAHFEND